MRNLSVWHLCIFLGQDAYITRPTTFLAILEKSTSARHRRYSLSFRNNRPSFMKIHDRKNTGEDLDEAVLMNFRILYLKVAMLAISLLRKKDFSYFICYSLDYNFIRLSYNLFFQKKQMGDYDFASHACSCPIFLQLSKNTLKNMLSIRLRLKLQYYTL